MTADQPRDDAPEVEQFQATASGWGPPNRPADQPRDAAIAALLERWDGYNGDTLLAEYSSGLAALRESQPAPADPLRDSDRTMAEYSDTRSACPSCGEWRDSPTSDCAACGFAPADPTADHALHFDPDCEECVYLARPVAIRVPADPTADLRAAVLLAFEDRKAMHGESCDCEPCIIVGDLTRVALGTTEDGA